MVDVISITWTATSVYKWLIVKVEKPLVKLSKINSANSSLLHNYLHFFQRLLYILERIFHIWIIFLSVWILHSLSLYIPFGMDLRLTFIGLIFSFFPFQIILNKKMHCLINNVQIWCTLAWKTLKAHMLIGRPITKLAHEIGAWEATSIPIHAGPIRSLYPRAPSGPNTIKILHYWWVHKARLHKDPFAKEFVDLSNKSVSTV